MPRPEALAELGGELGELRDARDDPFDLVAEIEPGPDPKPWAEAGATWVLTSFNHRPRLDEVLTATDAGP